MSIKNKLNKINSKHITNIYQDDLNDLIQLLYQESKLILPAGKYRFNKIYKKLNKAITIQCPLISYYKTRDSVRSYYYVSYLLRSGYKIVNDNIKIIVNNVKIFLDKHIKLR